MCGRFAQALPLGKLKKIDIFSGLIDPATENYNVAPGEKAAIIFFSDGYRLAESRWGFINERIKKRQGDKPFINARNETAGTGYFFRDSYKTGRCIIPANGFYEWEKSVKGKKPYFVYPDEKHDRIIFLAGIYTVINDSQNDTGFAVLTTSSVSPVKELHERMPVIIKTDDIADWLDPAAEDSTLKALSDMNRYETLSIHSVTNAMNNPRYKSHDCIEPAV